MLFFRPELGWCAVAALLLTSCGGSSSETPFPEEPLPDYLLERHEREPEAKPPAEAERPAPPPSPEQRAPENPPEQQTPPERQSPDTQQPEPLDGAGGAPPAPATENDAD